MFNLLRIIKVSSNTSLMSVSMGYVDHEFVKFLTTAASYIDLSPPMEC